jgi:hypothetical protein
MAMNGFFEGLQTAPIAAIAPEVLGPHVRRQEVDKRCLENVFLRFLVLVAARFLCCQLPQPSTHSSQSYHQ